MYRLESLAEQIKVALQTNRPVGRLLGQFIFIIIWSRIPK
jgi:hypothetical protein